MKWWGEFLEEHWARSAALTRTGLIHFILCGTLRVCVCVCTNVPSLDKWAACNLSNVVPFFQSWKSLIWFPLRFYADVVYTLQCVFCFYRINNKLRFGLVEQCVNHFIVISINIILLSTCSSRLPAHSFTYYSFRAFLPHFLSLSPRSYPHIQIQFPSLVNRCRCGQTNKKVISIECNELLFKNRNSIFL